MGIGTGDPNGSALDPQGRLFATASVLRAVIRVEPDATDAGLADRHDDKKFDGPNDIIVGPDMELYLTDPTLDLHTLQKQQIGFCGRRQHPAACMSIKSS